MLLKHPTTSMQVAIENMSVERIDVFAYIELCAGRIAHCDVVSLDTGFEKTFPLVVRSASC